jgi:hypothetical protein
MKVRRVRSMPRVVRETVFDARFAGRAGETGDRMEDSARGGVRMQGVMDPRYEKEALGGLLAYVTGLINQELSSRTNTWRPRTASCGPTCRLVRGDPIRKGPRSPRLVSASSGRGWPQVAMRDGIYPPRRRSPVCARRYCGYWRECEREFGGRVDE